LFLYSRPLSHDGIQGLVAGVYTFENTPSLPFREANYFEEEKRGPKDEIGAK
jgi:hypothetical protein